MSGLRLYVFGTPQLKIDDLIIPIERRKATALITYLALNQQSQSREVLAALLWPESPYEQARASLRSTLSVVKRLSDKTAEGWLLTDRTTVSIQPDRLWVDALVFRASFREAAAHQHTDDELCDDCVKRYTTASDLYQADFLNGFYLDDSPDFEDWQLQQRDWLRRDYAYTQQRLTMHFSRIRQYEQAIIHAQNWASCDALQENAHRQLMRLYALLGQRAEVMRQYERCVELCDEAFATPPESETTKLYESLMQNTAAASSHSEGISRRALGVIPPLPGLVIGREQALLEIRQRLGVYGGATRQVTVVHGWPGVGKSTTTAMLTHDAEIIQWFPDGILWASLGEKPDVLSEITGWASALGIHDASQMRKTEDISARIRAAIRDKQMLLLVDDVWDVEHMKAFRVGGQHCATIVVSRLFDVAQALAPTPTDLYRLPVLTEAASLELLAQLTPQTVSQYPEAARELVRDLEGLPLAIHVAGRLLQTESGMGWGIEHLLDELHTGAALLAAQPPTDVMVVGRDASPTVAALLNRSTDMLPPAMRLQFALLGLFVPKPATFHLEALSVAWDIQDPRPVIRHLVRLGLLEPVSGGRFQMHALLVMHAQSLLRSDFGM